MRYFKVILPGIKEYGIKTRSLYGPRFTSISWYKTINDWNIYFDLGHKGLEFGCTVFNKGLGIKILCL